MSSTENPGVESMVERVGRAIGRELIRQELAGECDFDVDVSNAQLARAAIGAMSEATEEMLDAAAPAHDGERLMHRVAYRLMLSAALVEKG